jgi:hypothetical protein
MIVAKQVIIGKALSQMLASDGDLDVLTDLRDVDEAVLAI